jgi:hypothetical protein
VIPWDTLITGAVGVAGIGGTILAARMTSSAQNERDRLAEKRRIYARFLACLHEMAFAVTHLQGSAKRTDPAGKPTRDLLDAFDKLYGVIHDLWACQAEVRLIAPTDLGLYAYDVAAEVMDYANKTMGAATAGSAYPEKFPSMAKMFMAMRADLGETSLEDHKSRA